MITKAPTRLIQYLKKIKKDNNQLILLTAENIYPNCWDEARAEAYKVLSGDYFTVIGSDDYIESSYISNCMEIIMKAPDKILAMQSPLMGIEGDTNALRGVIEHHYSSLKNFKEQSLNKCLVNSTTVVYNTSLLKDGLLKTNPEKYGGAADYDLYCSLADNGIMIYPFPRWIGFYYRWHKDQATWKVHKEAKNYDKMIQDYWREKWKS